MASIYMCIPEFIKNNVYLLSYMYVTGKIIKAEDVLGEHSL